MLKTRGLAGGHDTRGCASPRQRPNAAMRTTESHIPKYLTLIIGSQGAARRVERLGQLKGRVGGGPPCAATLGLPSRHRRHDSRLITAPYAEDPEAACADNYKHPQANCCHESLSATAAAEPPLSPASAAQAEVVRRAHGSTVAEQVGREQPFRTAPVVRPATTPPTTRAHYWLIATPCCALGKP